MIIIELRKIFLIILLILIFIHINEGFVIKNDPFITEPPKKAIVVFVTVYKYTEDNCITADGSVIHPGVLWCALSPDMFKEYNLSFGDTIVYKDVGYAIHDVTNGRLRHTVDILIHDEKIFAEWNVIYINKTPNDN